MISSVVLTKSFALNTLSITASTIEVDQDDGGRGKRFHFKVGWQPTYS